MKARAVIAPLLLAACSTAVPGGTRPSPVWAHAPRSGSSLSGAWWRSFGDPELDGLIQQAWQRNPDLELALQRIEVAKANREQAMARLFPRAGIQLGYRDGRVQDRTTGMRPVDVEPWQGEGGISWEIDLSGRLGAQLSAARAGEAVAYARWQGVRLLLATEVCAARFEDQLLAAEIRRQQAQWEEEKQAAKLTAELLERGLVASSEHAAAVGHAESLEREISELQRLQQTARLRLSRLLAGAEIPESEHQIQLPTPPSRVPSAVWQARPDLLAAEAQVRQAFARTDAARLDLLPSLSLEAGGSFGHSSLRGDYRMWKASVGPTLEIPIWDPVRLAEVKRSRAEAAAAAAHFRATADRAVEEIEGAYVDLAAYRAQMASLERETEARRQAWHDARAKSGSGLATVIEATDLGREYRDRAALATRAKLRALDAHLRLVKALGG